MKSQLIQEKIDDQIYWMSDKLITTKSNQPIVRLLPAFDEFLVAYKDRSAAVHPDFSVQFKNGGNGIFNSVLIINGQAIGIWKRTFSKEEIIIEIKPFTSLTQSQDKAISAEAKRYSRFIGMKLVIK